MIQIGLKVVFGVPEEIKPFVIKPTNGKMRLRLRPKCPAKVYVTSTGIIAAFLVEDRGDIWGLGPMVGMNKTLKSRE